MDEMLKALTRITRIFTNSFLDAEKDWQTQIQATCQPRSGLGDAARHVSVRNTSPIPIRPAVTT
jgi:hypothetical protein